MRFHVREFALTALYFPGLDGHRASGVCWICNPPQILTGHSRGHRALTIQVQLTGVPDLCACLLKREQRSTVRVADLSLSFDLLPIAGPSSPRSGGIWLGGNSYENHHHPYRIIILDAPPKQGACAGLSTNTAPNILNHLFHSPSNVWASSKGTQRRCCPRYP